MRVIELLGGLVFPTPAILQHTWSQDLDWDTLLKYIIYVRIIKLWQHTSRKYPRFSETAKKYLWKLLLQGLCGWDFREECLVEVIAMWIHIKRDAAKLGENYRINMRVDLPIYIYMYPGSYIMLYYKYCHLCIECTNNWCEIIWKDSVGILDTYSWEALWRWQLGNEMAT